MSILASFGKSKAYGQTVLPDRSVLVRQKLVEKAKIQMRYLVFFLTIVRHGNVIMVLVDLSITNVVTVGHNDAKLCHVAQFT